MPKHEHSYKATTVRVVTSEDSKATVVLKHCKCGAFDYDRIPGIWTMEEITGKSGRVKSDRQFMRAMGIRVGK
jgi:hypothetical protein